jgi:hypothetical protein
MDSIFWSASFFADRLCTVHSSTGDSPIATHSPLRCPATPDTAYVLELPPPEHYSPPSSISNVWASIALCSVFRVHRSEFVFILSCLCLDICHCHDYRAIPSRTPTDSQNLLPLGLAKMEIESSAANLGPSVDILCRRVAALQERFPLSTRRRILITLAGVPGSGKSTISTALTTSLREQGTENVVVLPMVLKTSR